MTPEPQGERASPTVTALRRLSAAFLALLGTRAELAATEFEEFRARQLEIAIAGVTAAVLLFVALLLVTLLVITAFWETHRLTAIGVALALYLGIGAFMGLRAHRLSQAVPKPFSATLEELRRDAAQLRGRPD